MAQRAFGQMLLGSWSGLTENENHSACVGRHGLVLCSMVWYRMAARHALAAHRCRAQGIRKPLQPTRATPPVWSSRQRRRRR